MLVTGAALVIEQVTGHPVAEEFRTRLFEPLGMGGSAFPDRDSTGFHSFMGHDPERDITVITWTSPAPSVDGRGPAVELAKAVIGALYAP